MCDTLDNQFAEVCETCVRQRLHITKALYATLRTSVDAFVAQYEEEQNPHLRIEQRFLDLRQLDLGVVYTSSVRLASCDEQCFFFSREEFGSHDVVGKQEEEHNTPDDGQASTEQEDDP